MAYNPNTKLLLQFTEADASTVTFDKSALFRRMDTIGPVEVFTGGGPSGMNCLTCGDPGNTNVQGMVRVLRPTPAKIYDPAIGGSMRFDFHFQKLVEDGSYQYIFGWGCAGDKYFRVYNPANDTTLVFESQLWDGTELKNYTKSAISGGLLNTWHHLRIYINSYTLTIGLDGVEMHSSSVNGPKTPADQSTYPFTLFDIGGFEGQKFLGNIAGFQYLQNDESWTGGAYTVPTAPYDEAPIPLNDYDTTTALQLLFNTETIEDTSSFQHPVTVAGSAVRVANDGPYGTGSLHVGDGDVQGGITVNSPGSILSDQYGNHVLDLWVWHDSSGTSNDYVFSMEDPVGGFILRLQDEGNSITADWYGNNYNDNAYIGAAFANPKSDAWHHVRLVMGNSMLIIACDGVEGQRYNTPSLLFSNYANVTLMEFGRYTSSYYFKGRMDGIVLRENDYSYYDGGANDGGSYVVPQLEPMKATLPGPLTVGLTGQSFGYAQGVFGVGLPVSYPVTGQSFAYALGNFKLRYDPIKGDPTLFGSHYAGRLVGDDLIPKAGQEDVAKIANEFWEAPAAPSSAVTVALAGQSFAYSLGVISAVNPTRVVALVGQDIIYGLGAITKNVGGPVTVGLTGQAVAYTQGALGHPVSVGVSGTVTGISAGAITRTQSVALAGVSAIPAAGTLSPVVRPAPLVGQSITHAQGAVGFSFLPDYDTNSLLLVKFNEANGATTVVDKTPAAHIGACLSVAAVTSSQGMFSSNGVAVGNPGGTKDNYAYVDFSSASGNDIYGLFLGADASVDKQIDVWFRPSTNNSHTLFSITLNNGDSVWLRSNMTTIEAQYILSGGTQLAYCSGTKTSNLNTWRHYRLLIDGMTMRVGYNGAEVCSTTIGSNIWTGDPLAMPYAIDASSIRIGRPKPAWDSAPYDFLAAQGYFDDFVITAGSVSWAGGAYTVPAYSPTDAPLLTPISAVGANTLDAMIGDGAAVHFDPRYADGNNTVDDCVGDGAAVHDEHMAEGANTVDDCLGDGYASEGVVRFAESSVVLESAQTSSTGVMTPISRGSGAAVTEAITSTGEGGIGWAVGEGAATLETFTSSGAGTVSAYLGPTGVGANTTSTTSSGTGSVLISGDGQNTTSVSSFGTVKDEQFAAGTNTVSVTSSGTARCETGLIGANTLEPMTSFGAMVISTFGVGESLVSVSSQSAGVLPIFGIGANTTSVITAPEYLGDDVFNLVCFERSAPAFIKKTSPSIAVRAT